MASEYGHIELVKFLLESGADLNMVDDDGWTPLHYASRHGNFEIIELLLDLGADINIKNEKGYTALHYAIINEDIEIVDLLLKRGTIVPDDEYGQTFYDLADECDDGFIITLLNRNK